MWNRVAVDMAANVAHPVGFDSVAPAPVLFQPDANESSSNRGLSGNGRNSPTAGTPPPKKARLPTTTPTMTQIHAMTGAVVPSFQRRTVSSSDTYVAVSRLRRNA